MTFQHSSNALVTVAIKEAIDQLHSFGNILDSVTNFDDVSEEMNAHFNRENENVIARLESALVKLQNQSPLNSYEVASVQRACLEKIQSLEKAQSWFCQMGDPTLLVASFQNQIRELSFAMVRFIESYNR